MNKLTSLAANAKTAENIMMATLLMEAAVDIITEEQKRGFPGINESADYMTSDLQHLNDMTMKDKRNEACQRRYAEDMGRVLENVIEGFYYTINKNNNQ